MGKRNRAALLATNLPQLQNLIKRDPESYKDEFIQQWRHFESSLSIFKLKPDEEAKEFGELITFLAQVSPCYPKESSEFPKEIMGLLSEHYQILEPNLRKNMVSALILLRNRDIITSTSLLSLFFTLFRCHDKNLREMLYTHIVNDIRNANNKHKNNKLNKTLQNFMFTMITSAEGAADNNSENAIAAKKSLDVCVELYKKNVWHDAKTVNVVVSACFSPVTRIMVTALQFFLGADEEEDSSDEEDDDVPDVRRMQQVKTFTKKTRAKTRALDKAIATVKRKERNRTKAENFNFSAIHLVNDPQGFVEKLFARLNKSSERFEVRLMIMKLIARLIGIHKLIFLSFYTYLIRYLQPHQRDVTQVLALTAQASHEIVPPDTLEPVLLAIANNFVTENMSSEVMSAGLNGIREICSRCPLAMTETLLQDLTEYKGHRDKGIMMASRSLIGLFREINPELLKKKDRGKGVTMSLKDFKPAQYGEARAAETIDGLDLLSKEKTTEEDDAAAWEGWEVESDDSEGEGDWVDVQQSDDETAIQVEMDSDEEKPKEEEENQEPVENIALTKILTPQDFARINELKTMNKAEQIIGKRKQDTNEASEEIVDESTILGPRKKKKQDYEERLESIKAGREGRSKFGSSKGNPDRGSTTNREKARNKAFMMVVHKRSVKQKSKLSLREKQKQLRTHINHQKKKGH
ncbi:Severe Depolymerization of Actin [Basidiobolus ranarum]|uniref:Protein SDA1 n=1 Tax=Basidiobolus ranarum TaxID=34480 RepID=A0ABR2VSZ2_9FUNG